MTDSTTTAIFLKIQNGLPSYDAKNPVLKEKVKNAKVLMPEDLESIAKQKPDLIVVDASDKNIDELKKIAPTIAIE